MSVSSDKSDMFDQEQQISSGNYQNMSEDGS